jgi:hypothetical protein
VSHGQRPATRRARTTAGGVALWAFLALALVYGVLLVVAGLTR